MKYKKPSSRPKIRVENRVYDKGHIVVTLPHLIFIWEGREVWHYIGLPDEVEEWAATINVKGETDQGDLVVEYGYSFPRRSFNTFLSEKRLKTIGPQMTHVSPSIVETYGWRHDHQK